MGTMGIFLCLFLGQLVAAQSFIKKQDAPNFQSVPKFFNNIRPFPFERNFEYTQFDSIFKSWGTRSPDFHMLAELPPITIVPRVEVFCDESKLTLLVDKRSNDGMLTGEELQLGNGCNSNKELPNQFVFTYSLDECGTTPVIENGLVMFTNSLHLNLNKPPPTWWQTPSTVHISCIPKRSYSSVFALKAFPENGHIFNIKAMNPSWTSSAESNIYKRGQVVNLQVSAKTRPEQRLFIQSCFVSASPEPRTRRKHALIMNKGCTAPLDSSHVIVQFVASDRADVVNLLLNTSYLSSELYIHCSVLMSDQDVNFGYKSCNYNLLQSRWEDLSGNVEVCECCSSKCKGLSARHLSEDTKATVSTGPFVIVDNLVEPNPEPSEPQETSSAPVTDAIRSHGATSENSIVSGTSVSRPLQGVVVVVSQDPGGRLTLRLPGQVQDAEYSKNIRSESEDNLTLKLEASNTVANDLPELRLLADKEPLLDTLTNEKEGQSANELGSEGQMWDLNLLTLVDGLAMPSQMEKVGFAEESQRKRFRRSGMFNTLSPLEVAVPLTDEMVYVDVLNQNDHNQMRCGQPDTDVMPKEEPSDAQPIIHSKLKFSKSTDGLHSLSFEEEVIRQQEGNWAN
ncbi:zona pellucida protein C isoform X2 [Etheostoma cragini]|uniref:zona pellucida protein C isoform X2 n=1 Tax=Etheostoma cragini TaxID=417921 RepID=UPI00155F2CC2|nr:zona pellucida protein C isoform X2 [Etheostoma cragini]